MSRLSPVVPRVHQTVLHEARCKVKFILLSDEDIEKIRQALYAAHCMSYQHRNGAYTLFCERVEQGEAITKDLKTLQNA